MDIGLTNLLQLIYQNSIWYVISINMTNMRKYMQLCEAMSNKQLLSRFENGRKTRNTATLLAQ